MSLRLFRNSMFFLQRLLAAILGFVLFPIVQLLKFLVSTPAITDELLIAMMELSFAAGVYVEHAFSVGILGAIATTVIVASAMSIIVGVLLPIYLGILAGVTLITAPFQGLQRGWGNGSIMHMIRAPYAPPFDVRDNIPQSASFARVIASLEQEGEPEIRNDFANLELSAQEYRQLIANVQSPLTAEQLAQIPSDRATEIGKSKDRYLTLQELNTDTCQISIDRPERANTILLVKQYQKDGAWHPVPAKVNIFDKEQLELWVTAGGTHPGTRDNLFVPAPHSINHVEYPTRYVFHNYYPNASAGPGVSQELNTVASVLHAYLVAHPLRQAPQQEELALPVAPSFQP